MNKVKEVEKWIIDANVEIDKLHGERDCLTNVVRIQGDFIDCE